jgi:hypothetical protein
LFGDDGDLFGDDGRFSSVKITESGCSCKNSNKDEKELAPLSTPSDFVDA